MLNVKYIYSQIKLRSPNFRIIHEINHKLYKPGFNNEKIKQRLESIFYPNNTFYNFYENKNVLPRIFFVNKIYNFKNSDVLLKYMYLNKKSFNEFIPTLNQEYKTTKSNLNKQSFKIQKYTSDDIFLKLSISDDINLVVLNNLHPRWIAISNTGQKEIIDAYHSFYFIRLNENDEYLRLLYK